MNRHRQLAEPIAQAAGLEIAVVMQIFSSLIACLQNMEHAPTDQEQIRHAKEQTTRDPERAYRIAFRSARRHGVPREKREQVARSVVDKLMATDEPVLVEMFAEVDRVGEIE